jgi:hypothetical protein
LRERREHAVRKPSKRTHTEKTKKNINFVTSSRRKRPPKAVLGDRSLPPAGFTKIGTEQTKLYDNSGHPSEVIWDVYQKN